jgi:phosphoglycerol geranylgeranyltransferase
MLVNRVQVWEYFNSKIPGEKIHLTLIDPNNQSPAEAGEMCKYAQEAGTDAIMVGGSTGVSRESFDATIKAIKNNTSLPVIIFPTNANSLSKHADAVFFMSLLNSKNIKYITREQSFGARFVQQTGLEPISMGYIIVAPGMKVGEVGEAELTERDDIEESINYALLAEYFGMKLVYLEAGSGAPKPVTSEMVAAVKNNIKIPLIIGGGIRTPEVASEIARAGADVIVTGTIVEDSKNIKSTLGTIINSIKDVTNSRATP